MILINDKEIESFTFSGGEVQVKVPIHEREVSVLAYLYNSNDIIQLIMVDEALKGNGCKIKHLEIPYLPYARQDRACSIGEAFSLKAMARIINNIGAKTVFVWDVHSSISEVLIDNLVNVPQSDFIGYDVSLSKKLRDANYFVCSPDAGALKKIQEVQKVFHIPNERVITALKQRDVDTGEITETQVHLYKEYCKPKKVIIIDDICDGGRTFIELAKSLRSLGVEEISLYVTHGIFSKGFKGFQGLIDHVHTPHSFISKNYPNRETIRRLQCIEADQVQL